MAIGPGKAPAIGVLLQLKNMDGASGDANANCGLMIPRVNLEEVDNLQPITFRIFLLPRRFSFTRSLLECDNSKINNRGSFRF